MKIEIEGMEDVMDMFDGFTSKIEGKLSKGLARGLKVVEGEAKARCPVSTEKTRPGGPHGELRDSIHSKVDGLYGEAGTNKEYALYVELGTYKMRPQPYLVPALKEKTGEIIKEIKENFN